MLKGFCTQDGFVPNDLRVDTAAPASRPSVAVSNCTIVGRRGGGFAQGHHRIGGRDGLAPLIVTGCARRIAATLSNTTIPYVEGLLLGASAFKIAAAVYIFHDDPTDNATLAVLHAWAARERRVRLILSDMGARGERIQRLTLCRNVLLAEASDRLRAFASTAAEHAKRPATVRGAARGFAPSRPHHGPATLPLLGSSVLHGTPPASLPPSGVAAVEGFVASLDLDCRHGRPDQLLSAVRRMREDAAARTLTMGAATMGAATAPGDGASNGPTADGVGFDVLTANNLGAYRDMWALRAAPLGMDYDW